VNRLFALLFGFAALGLFVPSLSEHLLELQKTQKIDEQDANTKKAGEIEAKSVSLSSGEVRLKPDARGHYVADFKMNGRVVTALVDTGASSVAINKSTARKLGLNITANDFIYEASTANGKTKMAIATIREIQIGRILVRNVEAAVLDDKALDGTLLGMSFLRQLDGFTVSDGDLILKQ
jgi:aspartyl protease family protein